MKVYVLCSGEYSSRGNVAVFSARAHLDLWVQAQKGWGEPDVEEFDVDPDIKELHAGLHWYEITMTRSGDVVKCEQGGPQGDLHPEFPFTPANEDWYKGSKHGSPVSGGFNFQKVIIAKNKTQAIKAANEQRTQWIAMKGWPDKWP